MQSTRRHVLGGAVAALATPLLARYAKAAEYSWKFAHTAPQTFPFHIRLAEAAAQIGKDSNGRMELQVFPDGQLGGDNDLLSQARSGAIEFCQPTGQIFSSILPVTAISALGFAWSDYAKVWPAMDGELGAYVRAQIAAKIGTGGDGSHVGPRVPPDHHQHQADHGMQPIWWGSRSARRWRRAW